VETAASPNALHARGIFANRTLNLRSIRAVGYDMDYTLVHYRVEPWERRAYEHTRQRLVARGWPVGHLTFVPDLAVRGLIIDTELGNVVKANRFGYVKRAHHGTALVPFEEQRKVYARVIVDLAKPRWEFLNTLFSLSEACLFMQLVEMLDARQLPEVLGYADLYRAVRESVDASHMEGRLKQEIAADPDTFVVLDPEVPLALLDQKYAGKKLLLITNSEWPYTASMMHYAFDRFLPEGTTWRQLFDLVIVGASKPGFFQGKREVFEVATEEGLLKPWYGKLREGACYYGGHAALVESSLGVSGDDILYVGDHIFGDVSVSKSFLRWRTALILREIEDEIVAEQQARKIELELGALMIEKEALEQRFCQVRLLSQRQRGGYAPGSKRSRRDQATEVAALRAKLAELDARIGPMAQAVTVASNPNWGLMMRAGNDKSHLARQVERWADVYTSRVSNFLLATPFAFMRAPRGSLPHDTLGNAPPAAEAGTTTGKL
jgi:HAD superfamily 5'-nucleotidase-like hydrolase